MHVPWLCAVKRLRGESRRDRQGDVSRARGLKAPRGTKPTSGCLPLQSSGGILVSNQGLNARGGTCAPCSESMES